MACVLRVFLRVWALFWGSQVDVPFGSVLAVRMGLSGWSEILMLSRFLGGLNRPKSTTEEPWFEGTKDDQS